MNKIKRTALCCVSLIALTTAFNTSPSIAQSAEKFVEVNVEAQSLDQALTLLAQQFGKQIIISSEDATGLEANPLLGTYSERQALELLLKGTKLSYKYINGRTIAVYNQETTDISDFQNISYGENYEDNLDVIATDERADDVDDLVLDTIVVTGSRIARDGFVMPTPTTVLNAEAISASGVTNIADIVRELPALGQGVSANVEGTGIGAAGLNLLDLRGLGGNRTLVLVNGRRQVASVPGSSQVDINTIPSALVERVEVITGGASAVYGADAVTGVVNFTTKKDFEGIQFDSTVGAYEAGDGENYNLSVTAGHNFDDDRGNVWFSATYDQTKGIRGSDRQRVRNQTIFQPNPDPDGPARVLIDDLRIFVLNRNGVIVSPTGALPPFAYAFDADGNVVPYDTGEVLSGGAAIGGDGLNLTSSVQLQSPTKRVLLSGGVNYQVSDDVNVFIEGKYSNVDGTSFTQALGNTGDLFISTDNAYLPEDFAGFLAAGGHPGILLFRYHEDLGNRIFSLDANSYSLLLGADGHIFDDIKYEVYYQFGRSTSTTSVSNVQNIARLNNASDAVFDGGGNIVCRNPEARSDGCVPLNLIGYNRMSPEARDYVNSRLTKDNVQKMHLAGAAISGDLMDLPAGELAFAAGVEWRQESSNSVPDLASRDGSTRFSNQKIVKGSYNVKEIFFEARAPLVADAPFAKEINIEGAFRASDYSTVGTTTTWKIGGDWVPVDDVRFRATYSRASRAPNINELFSPSDSNQAFVTDPCDVSNVGSGATPAQRAANCAALGLPADFESDATFTSVNVVISGNPDLDEEVAKTYTAGVVLTPTFLPGLSVSVDLWDMKITNAIDSLDATSVLSSCVDFEGNPELCALINRDTDGQINSISVTQLNLASFDARGVDFEVRYGTDLSGDGGYLNFNLLGTYLNKLDFLLSENDPSGIIRSAGGQSAPKWMMNFDTSYIRGDLGVNWSIRYVGKSRNGVVPTDADPFYSAARFYHDLNVRYEVIEGTSAFVGVNNIFNNGAPRSVGFQQAGHYDTKGRYFYAGLSTKF